MNIRKAKIEDLPRIVEIYNWAIENTTATFDTESKTVEDQTSWFFDHDEDHPLVAIELENVVVGWGSISSWSDRCAYSGTGELSFYIHPDHHGKGVGSYLLNHLIELGKRCNFRTLISRVSAESNASLYLHRKNGFEEIGIMKSVGLKFGREIDVVLFQTVF